MKDYEVNGLLNVSEAMETLLYKLNNNFSDPDNNNKLREFRITYIYDQ